MIDWGQYDDEQTSVQVFPLCLLDMQFTEPILEMATMSLKQKPCSSILEHFHYSPPPLSNQSCMHLHITNLDVGLSNNYLTTNITQNPWAYRQES
jgi:hypothetical protein